MRMLRVEGAEMGAGEMGEGVAGGEMGAGGCEVGVAGTGEERD